MRKGAFVDAGNNVLNASDIKTAMEYCDGIKNLWIAVAKNDQTAVITEKTILPEISSIRSIQYTPNGMVLGKSSGIGDGLFILYSNPTVKPNMKLIEPFEPAPTPISRRLNNNKQRSKPRIDRQYNTYYFCPVDNCTKVFQSENELLEHIAVGLHEEESSTDKTSDDIARLQLFQKLQHTNLSTLTSTQPQVTKMTTDQPLLPKHMIYFEGEGHCLRPKRQNKAIDPDIKLFLKTETKSKINSQKCPNADSARKQFLEHLSDEETADINPPAKKQRYSLRNHRTKDNTSILEGTLDDDFMVKSTVRSSARIHIPTIRSKPLKNKILVESSDSDYDDEDEKAWTKIRVIQAAKRRLLT
ncbi:unnamed protein product [Didymodactylos carnosus]|uniref:C2H2-type domain-containing protein n=1 Tax=Didymodactylos carnosus TaxID=1234261 RepID=A0A814EJD5_9BILA|nr:unnamed protein product [Didymodactylos carnosus]CAF3743333.1 unnamed protein product [Didymodactylos carnosus]